MVSTPYLGRRVIKINVPRAREQLRVFDRHKVFYSPLFIRDSIFAFIIVASAIDILRDRLIVCANFEATYRSCRTDDRSFVLIGARVARIMDKSQSNTTDLSSIGVRDKAGEKIKIDIAR